MFRKKVPPVHSGYTDRVEQPSEWPGISGRFRVFPRLRAMTESTETIQQHCRPTDLSVSLGSLLRVHGALSHGILGFHCSGLLLSSQ